ncbi:type IV pilin protein [Alishewanella sp. d11]|uniref:type IV pilin protein n=1 Tax=Alishewanella sp. d11 TaxID=3414030 RepID=UPI003BF87D07
MELMIVVAIIGILAAISIPSYNNYIAKTANNSCQSEIYAYTKVAAIAIYENTTIPNYTPSRCNAITGTISDSNSTFTTTAIPPGGSRIITCSIASANCTIAP